MGFPVESLYSVQSLAAWRQETGNCSEAAAGLSLPGDEDPKLVLYEGFPKLGGIFLGVHIIRTIVFWGLYWGSPIVGNYHIGVLAPSRFEIPDLASNDKSRKQLLSALNQYT